ncbi:MAG: MiaB/RimO family radical SAM methylthiotransferase, partial [Acidobacteriota bacterium]|nr:MiaB/RimO family radical SAM methylthiotransferase [Acidobacteriota bacterium]
LEDVLAEVSALARRGVLEVEFLGQTVNAYRDEAGRTLADLLRRTAEIDGVRRVRFTTSHPAQMTPALIEAMSDARPQLCPYLHLPVQSGSSTVLERMRRGYDRQGYLSRIAALRRRMPDLRFGTDIIVGFPGETDAEFEETLTLLDDVPFDTVYSFAYSERPGTRAIDLGDTVPLALKIERLRRLQERQKQIQEHRHREFVGRTVEVLVEGPSKRDPSRWTGRTADNRIVHFPGDSAPGRLSRVRVTESTAYCLHGLPEAANA